MKIKSFNLCYLVIIALLTLPACSSDDIDREDDIIVSDSDSDQAAPRDQVDSELPLPEEGTTEEVPSTAATDATSNQLAENNSEATLDALTREQQNSIIPAPGPDPATEGTSSVAVEGTEVDDSLLQNVVDSNLKIQNVDNSEAAVPSEIDSKSDYKQKKSKNNRKNRIQKQTHIDQETSTNELATQLKSYIIQPGDTLGKISALLYGSSKKWRHLAKVNNLSSYSRIYAGNLLRYVPNSKSEEFEARWNSLARKKIVVKKHDSLSSLAQRVLGEAAFWKLFWKWNQDKIPNPNRLNPGLTLSYVSREDLDAFFKIRSQTEISH